MDLNIDRERREEYARRLLRSSGIWTEAEELFRNRLRFKLIPLTEDTTTSTVVKGDNPVTTASMLLVITKEVLSSFVLIRYMRSERPPFDNGGLQLTSTAVELIGVALTFRGSLGNAT